MEVKDFKIISRTLTGVPFPQETHCHMTRNENVLLNACMECHRLTKGGDPDELTLHCRFMQFRKLRYSSKTNLIEDGFTRMEDASPDYLKNVLPRFVMHLLAAGEILPNAAPDVKQSSADRLSPSQMASPMKRRRTDVFDEKQIKPMDRKASATRARAPDEKKSEKTKYLEIISTETEVEDTDCDNDKSEEDDEESKDDEPVASTSSAAASAFRPIRPWVDAAKLKRIPAATQIVQQLCNAFCRQIRQDRLFILKKPHMRVFWRPLRSAVIADRCDICRADLFNLHFFCSSCSFLVCLQCQKERTLHLRFSKHGFHPPNLDVPPRLQCRGAQWTCCSQRDAPHNAYKLNTARTIPLPVLYEMQTRLHHICDLLNLPACEQCSQEEQEVETYETYSVSTGMAAPPRSRFTLPRAPASSIVPAVLMEPIALDQANIEQFERAMTARNPIWTTAINLDSALSIENEQELFERIPYRDFASSTGFRNLYKCMKAFSYPVPHPRFEMFVNEYDQQAPLDESVIKEHTSGSTFTKCPLKQSLRVNVIDSMHVAVYTNRFEMLSVDRQDNLLINYFASKMENCPWSPAAIWHVYHPKDAETIRIFFGEKLGTNFSSDPSSSPSSSVSGWNTRKFYYNGSTCCHVCAQFASSDPLFDGLLYLDGNFRRQLAEEYHVTCKTIVQEPGQVVVIPAGAPFQVSCSRNSIRLSTDFLNPLNIESFLDLAEQIRVNNVGRLNPNAFPRSTKVIFFAIGNALDRLLLSK